MSTREGLILRKVNSGTCKDTKLVVWRVRNSAPVSIFWICHRWEDVESSAEVGRGIDYVTGIREGDFSVFQFYFAISPSVLPMALLSLLLRLSRPTTFAWLFASSRSRGRWKGCSRTKVGFFRRSLVEVERSVSTRMKGLCSRTKVDISRRNLVEARR